MTNLATWLCFAAVVPAAVMMRPSFASLIAVAVLIACVVTLRLVARAEGAAAVNRSRREGGAP
jgi:hypothetical protein